MLNDDVTAVRASNAMDVYLPDPFLLSRREYERLTKIPVPSAHSYDLAEGTETVLGTNGTSGFPFERLFLKRRL